MSDDQPRRPSILANLILMLIVGLGLFIFIAITKGCGKSSDTKPEIAKSDPPATAPPPTQTPAAASQDDAGPLKVGIGKSAATPAPKPKITGRQVPVPNDRPPPTVASASTPPAATGQPGAGTPAAGAPAAVDPDAPPPPEPVREVATGSPEGAAMLKDAIARIDEAPADLYPEKAKSKVREGLKGARRIFKVDTIYFEKGGAKLPDRDKERLTKALQTPAIQEASSDPRAVYFVLGFADKTGDAATNKKLSFSRADAVITALETDIGVFNLIYPVAVGPTEIVSPENQQKNRAAEVWLVLP